MIHISVFQIHQIKSFSFYSFLCIIQYIIRRRWVIFPQEKKYNFEHFMYKSIISSVDFKDFEKEDKMFEFII